MKFSTIKDYAVKNNIQVKSVYKRAKNNNCKLIKCNSESLVITDNKPTVMTLINHKGGVGKTTSAINIACYLAKCDLRVLLIDVDHQDQCKLFFEFEENGKSSYDIFFTNEQIEKIIKKTNILNLDLINGSEEISIYEYDLAEETKKDTTILSKRLHNIINNYDFIIIDTNPSFNIYNQNAIISSDYVLIPTLADNLSLSGVDSFIDRVKKVIRNTSTEILGIFFTMIDVRTSQSSTFMDYTKKMFGNLVFDSYINRDVRVSESSLAKKNIFDYKNNCKGSKSYKKLVNNILKRI